MAHGPLVFVGEVIPLDISLFITLFISFRMHPNKKIIISFTSFEILKPSSSRL